MVKVSERIVAKLTIMPPKKDWKLLNTFDTKEKLLEEISLKCVHERRIKSLKSGVKVIYECKQKKKFDCEYELYHFTAGIEGAPFELFEFSQMLAV